MKEGVLVHNAPTPLRSGTCGSLFLPIFPFLIVYFVFLPSNQFYCPGTYTMPPPYVGRSGAQLKTHTFLLQAAGLD